MVPADLSARPLGMAEVIDTSIALARRHFRALFLAMLVAQVPAFLLARRLAGVAELLGGALGSGPSPALLLRAARDLAWITAALVLLQLAATAAAAAIVRPSLDPRRVPRPRPALAAAAVAGAAGLQVFLLAAAPALGALPGLLLAVRAGTVPTAVAGALGALAGGVTLLLLAVVRLVLTPAAALEGGGPLRALARSFRLMAPRPGDRLLGRPGLRASLVLLATFVLAMAVNGLAGIPRLVAMRAELGPGGFAGLAGLMGGRLPPALDVALAMFEALAAAALQPFSLVPVAVLYHDRRARAEALDLEIWADRLEEAG